jgi:hypothetical protein
MLSVLGGSRVQKHSTLNKTTLNTQVGFALQLLENKKASQ